VLRCIFPDCCINPRSGSRLRIFNQIPALLGAILAGHRQAGEILDTLKPDDFFDDQHRLLVGVMNEMHAAGTPVDLLAMHDELVFRKMSNAAGGTPYLAGLVDGPEKSGDIFYVLRGLCESPGGMQPCDVAENVKQLGFEQAGSADALLDSAIEKFSNLALVSKSTLTSRSWTHGPGDSARVSLSSSLRRQGRGNPYLRPRSGEGLAGTDTTPCSVPAR
jgi:hypothetical protein